MSTRKRPSVWVKMPIEVRAMQWDGTATGATEIIDWVLRSGGTARYHEDHIAVDTLEGTMRLFAGSWMMQGVQGEFYPCKDDILRASYTPRDGYAATNVDKRLVPDWTDDGT